MNPNETETVSALLDGEAVDPAELREILEDPTGRALLVDFVGLRRAVRSDASAPGREFYARMAREGLTGEASSLRGPWRLAAAAALILAAGLGGTAGFLVRPEPEPEGPPVAARTVVFERGVNWSATDGGEEE